MDKLEKSIYYCELYNFYRKLLTKKRNQIFYDYYFKDIGLTEISENLKISRQAVLDSIKKTEIMLDDYEKKLKLYNIFNKQKEIINNIQKTNNTTLIDKILVQWEE